MSKLLASIILMTVLSPSTFAKMKCNPNKHIEISCSDVKNHKREGFCLKIGKKKKLTESKKVKICQSASRVKRKK